MTNIQKTYTLAIMLIAFSFSFTLKNPGPGNLPALTSVDIGNVKAGTTTLTKDGEGVTIQGYGTLFGMHHSSDQGRFAYTKIKGDFDVIIQVENISSSTGAFTEGGLMVRKDLNPKGLMLANFVTNNNYQGETDHYTFMFRLKEEGSIEPYEDMAIDGFYGTHTKGNPAFGYSARGWNQTNTPARPFPYVWLRVMRQGNLYKGYRRSGTADNWGEWEKMSEVTADFGEAPLVGLALSANHHHSNKSGAIGDPASMSELSVLKISGLK